MLDYINKRTGENVVFQVDFGSRIKGAIILLLLAATAFILGFKLRPVISNPVAWFVFACGIFFVCCGGITYNILKKPLLVGKTNTKTGLEYKFISTDVKYSLSIEKKSICT